MQDKKEGNDGVRVPLRKYRTRFNQLLISAVESRPAIWDLSDPDHKNGKKVMSYWKEIAVELKGTVNLVMNRWRNLRDTYKKYLRQIAAAIKSGTSSKVSWVHFDQLQFINTSLALKEASGNLFLSKIEHRNAHAENEFVISNEISLQSAADESWDANNYENSFEMSAPLEEQLSCEDGPRFVHDGSNENSPGPEQRSLSTKQLRAPAMSARENPSRKRRYNTHNAHKDPAVDDDGQLADSAHNLRLLDNHFQAIMQSSMDSIDHFLLSLAPHVRDTPQELLPSLKMNLMYIACKYSKGVVPTELLQLDI